jgi:hypothetical protein
VTALSMGANITSEDHADSILHGLAAERHAGPPVESEGD